MAISYAIAVFADGVDHYMPDGNDIREFDGEFAVALEALLIRWVEKHPERKIELGLAAAPQPPADNDHVAPGAEPFPDFDLANEAALGVVSTSEPELPLDPEGKPALDEAPAKAPEQHEDGLDV